MAEGGVLASEVHAAELCSSGKPVPRLMKYAEVHKGLQCILQDQCTPIKVSHLEQLFEETFANSIVDIVGMPTSEYLMRKENTFNYCAELDTVSLRSKVARPLQPSVPPSVAAPLPNEDDSVKDTTDTIVKDESFVICEFEKLVEEIGPVAYISTLCGRFIARNGISVSSAISTRPVDVFKRHPDTFLILGAGYVTLRKFQLLPEVQELLNKSKGRGSRVTQPSEQVVVPSPEAITDQDVVEEFKRLILSDNTHSVYISSLCGRFHQRFKIKVTEVINCKPAQFLRQYPNIFVLTGGGNVGLREVLGPDVKSVPEPPKRMPKTKRDERQLEFESPRFGTDFFTLVKPD